MANAACKLLLCSQRLAGEIASADGMAQLSGMSTVDLDDLFVDKFDGQSNYDAAIAGIEAAIGAAKKVNEVLLP